ncbi:MAG: hypothetical protein AAF466_09595, partial [Bacteroidota bacterium]
ALFVTAPPLGLMAVAAYVRQQAEQRGEALELKILDLNPQRQLPSEVVPEILEKTPATHKPFGYAWPIPIVSW